MDIKWDMTAAMKKARKDAGSEKLELQAMEVNAERNDK
jgi:hypothetical protein